MLLGLRDAPAQRGSRASQISGGVVALVILPAACWGSCPHKSRSHSQPHDPLQGLGAVQGQGLLQGHQLSLSHQLHMGWLQPHPPAGPNLKP